MRDLSPSELSTARGDANESHFFGDESNSPPDCQVIERRLTVEPKSHVVAGLIWRHGPSLPRESSFAGPINLINVELLAWLIQWPPPFSPNYTGLLFICPIILFLARHRIVYPVMRPTDKVRGYTPKIFKNGIYRNIIKRGNIPNNPK